MTTFAPSNLNHQFDPIASIEIARFAHYTGDRARVGSDILNSPRFSSGPANIYSPETGYCSNQPKTDYHRFPNRGFWHGCRTRICKGETPGLGVGSKTICCRCGEARKISVGQQVDARNIGEFEDTAASYPCRTKYRTEVREAKVCARSGKAVGSTLVAAGRSANSPPGRVIKDSGNAGSWSQQALPRHRVGTRKRRISQDTRCR